MKIKDKWLFEMLREYLTVHLPFRKKVSPHTCKSYQEVLNLLMDFLSQYNAKSLKDLCFDNISDESVDAFLLWLEKEHHCKPSTLNHHLSVVRAFLKYCAMKKPVYQDYYLSVGKIPRRKTIKRCAVNHFSKASLDAILQQPNVKTKHGHRDLFYMILLYDTGARDREILDLHPADIIADTKAPYIIIRGKGSKIRTIPIMNETVLHYKSYMKRFHMGPTDADTFLFYTTIHGIKHAMSDDNVARFISKYATVARTICFEVPAHVTPHMFRHSRALHLYQKGVPLPLIAQWLGHSSMETTLIYAYADTEMKRVAIEKATEKNHPIRTQEYYNGSMLNDETLKKLYGLR
jgi:site-specific recombinase XerD